MFLSSKFLNLFLEEEKKSENHYGYERQPKKYSINFIFLRITAARILTHLFFPTLLMALKGEKNKKEREEKRKRLRSQQHPKTVVAHKK